MKLLRIIGEPAPDHDGAPVSVPAASERIAELEQLVAERTHALELAATTDAKSRCFLTRVVESMSSGLWVFEADGRTELVNAEGVLMTGSTMDRARAMRFAQIFPTLSFDELTRPGAKLRRECLLTRADGSTLPVLLSTTVLTSGPCDKMQLIVTCEDLTDQKALESSLRTAQKLEAVGRLAAGVAHEVNTPIQFIGDGVRFLQDCVRDLAAASDRVAELFTTLKARGALTREDEERLAEIHSDADADFIFAEAPAAMERTLRGVGRVAEIVRALRAFSHPDHDRLTLGDVNAAVRDACVVARVECKRVAELVLDLGDLPPVECNLNELMQVFLNLLINASHAIESRPDGGRGTITVRTEKADGLVQVAITDDGAGISEAAQARLFEPFFTTKAPGKGTGQGLALALDIVEKHHRGALSFSTTPGKGTTFRVRLPLRQPPGPGVAP